jgi:hypothetical protein
LQEVLNDNIGNLSITDFSLHSIGVILFRYSKEEVFRKFVENIMLNIKLLSCQWNYMEKLQTSEKA